MKNSLKLVGALLIGAVCLTGCPKDGGKTKTAAKTAKTDAKTAKTAAKTEAKTKTK